MNHLKTILLCLMLLFQASYAFATEEPMNNIEEANLLKAIEDYRFNDFDASITILTDIHAQHPNHLRSIRYLALSYRDSQQNGKAAKMFKLWISKANNKPSIDKRFAYLGAAKAEIALKNDGHAISLLQQWLILQPNDNTASIMLADIQIRNQSLPQAEKTLDTIIQQPATTNTEKAGAWYYKAWIAYLNVDPENTQKFAKKSLLFDSNSIYATPARNLIASPPRKKVGFSGVASLGIFYNSNVELLPDILKSTGSTGDTGLETNLQFNWGFKKVEMNYTLMSINHQNQKDFDMLLHLLSVPISYGSWQFLPTLEAASLSNQPLYQGVGLGVYYNQQGWAYHYTIKTKSFSDSFGDLNINLTRLSGTSHNIGITKQLKLDRTDVSFSSDVTSEQTQGDRTHDKSDNYLQIAVGIQTISPLTKDFRLTNSLNIYSRNYKRADTSILINTAADTKRSDTFYEINTSAKWQPLTNKGSTFIFSLSYQSNNSNYDSGTVGNASIKSYSAWKVSSSFSQQW